MQEHQAEVKKKLDKTSQVETPLQMAKPKVSRASLSNESTRKKLATAVEEWDCIPKPKKTVIVRAKWAREWAKQFGVSESCLRQYISDNLE